ncbi:MAG: porphobilinogen synthase [Phycisphaerales bacterium]|nr:MAG: porphobilinogen synthase [Phycisphaerales bacterium]
MPPQNLPSRPRRLRRTEAVRRLVRETSLTPRQLVLPLFLIEGEDRAEPIDAMPGCSRFSIDRAIGTAEQAMTLGVRAFALFPAVSSEKKSPAGDEGLREDNLLCRAVIAMRQALPDACLITDIALDPYSNFGHDGIVSADGRVLNDETVDVLTRMTQLHAQVGADFVAPSDMMDGRVGAIRRALDGAGYTETGIISYAAKYASAFYGPFREALDSAPIDAPNVPRHKKTYQMDPANTREALREAALDEAEGADILLVKPGLPYLDIITRLRERTTLPIAAYQVSGEYAMIKSAAELGRLDETAAMVESLTALARAGADVIFTYFALEYAVWYRANPG